MGMGMETTQQTFTVFAERKDEVRALLSKLERKARRKGSAFSFSFGAHYLKPVEVGGLWESHKVKIAHVDVTVKGEYPRVGKFSFLGRIEFAAAGVLVQSVPGVELDPKYRDAKPICEHCGTSRRRNDVFVVRNDTTGRESVVGRSCLQEYLGCDLGDLLSRFDWFKAVREMADEYGGGGRCEGVVSTLDVLTLTSVFIRLEGWLSKSAMREDDSSSTAEKVRGLLYSYSKDPDWLAWRTYILQARTEADRELAVKVIEWARALIPATDYEHNLHTLLGSDVASERHTGLIASAVAAYSRAVGADLHMRHQRADKTESAYVGTEGARLKGITATIISQRCVGESSYGPVVYNEFLADDGNVFMWKSSKGTGFPDGSRVKLTGTVKKHAEYAGVRQTWLTRCAITEA